MTDYGGTVRHTRHRRDANHDEIIAGLKRVTVVRDIHNYGGGMGDILALNVRTRQPVFLEVKPPGRYELTASERVFKSDFGACSIVVQSLDQALEAVGLSGPVGGPRASVTHRP